MCDGALPSNEVPQSQKLQQCLHCHALIQGSYSDHGIWPQLQVTCTPNVSTGTQI